MRRTLRGLMLVQTKLGPSRDYAPMAGRVKPVILPQSNRPTTERARRCGPARPPAGQAVVQRIPLLGRRPAHDLAHDRNDLLHNITAGAAGSTSQQILDRSADFCFGIVRARKLP